MRVKIALVLCAIWAFLGRRCRQEESESALDSPSALALALVRPTSSPSSRILLRLSIRSLWLLSPTGLCSTGTGLCAASTNLRARSPRLSATGSGPTANLLYAVSVRFDVSSTDFATVATTSTSDPFSACGDRTVSETFNSKTRPVSPVRHGPFRFDVRLVAVLAKVKGQRAVICDRRRFDDEHEIRSLDQGLCQTIRRCFVRLVPLPVHRLRPVWGSHGRTAWFWGQASVRDYLQVGL